MSRDLRLTRKDSIRKREEILKRVARKHSEIINTGVIEKAVEELDDSDMPNLGLATTEQLIDEIKARIEIAGLQHYRTSEPEDKEATNETISKD